MSSKEKPSSAAPTRVVKGMAKYFEDVANVELGVSEVDFLLVNTPPTCNYRCKKCFTNANTRKPGKPLSFEEWKKVISDSADMGVKNVSILGEGEPLIYPPIEPLVKHINKSGAIPMIATNARELDEETADFLFDNNATVGFSLDTLDADEYNDFCGGNADFGVVMKNIEYARNRFAEAIQIEKGFKVHRFLLHMTVTPQNFHLFDQMKDFCEDDIYFDPQPLANVGEAETQEAYFGEEESYEQYQKDGHVLYPPMVLAKAKTGDEVCCLFYMGVAINHTGDVMFDTHAIEPENFIGNVRDVPLPELVKRVRKLREYFLQNFEAGYCPIRDDAYKEFLKTCNDKLKKVLWG